MDTHKSLPVSPGTQKRNPFFLVLAIFILLVAGAWAFYLQLQKSAIEEQKKAVTAEMEVLQTEIDAMQEQKLEAAQLAQQWLDAVEAEEIIWSRVMTRMEKLLPRDLTGNSKVNILSYSGASGGKVNVSAQTVPAQLEPYEYVSELLVSFNTSEDFMNAVIPSLTKGETDDGAKFLSFAMSLTFNRGSNAFMNDPEAEEDAADGTADVSGEDTTRPKVPRQ